MSIKLHAIGYTFTPKLVTTLLTLILVPFLVSLGFWQLERADEKRIIDNGVQEAIAKPALQLNNNSINLSDIEGHIYRSVNITGHYDKKQFLLDNRTHKGLPGYHVISPFIFKQNTTTFAVLINRGWITYNGTRDNISDITLEPNQIEISGSLKKVPESIVLKEQSGENEIFSQDSFKTDNKILEDVALVQAIQMDKMSKALNYQLLPIILELDKNTDQGFIREWQPYFGSIDKHNAYALQWFSMAAILLFLYFKLNIRKD